MLYVVTCVLFRYHVIQIADDADSDGHSGPVHGHMRKRVEEVVKRSKDVVKEYSRSRKVEIFDHAHAHEPNHPHHDDDAHADDDHDNLDDHHHHHDRHDEHVHRHRHSHQRHPE